MWCTKENWLKFVFKIAFKQKFMLKIASFENGPSCEPLVATPTVAHLQFSSFLNCSPNAIIIQGLWRQWTMR